MAEATAFVFRMDISGAQSAVGRAYQDVVWSESFGSRLVYEVLRLCVVTNRLDLVSCHCRALDAQYRLLWATGWNILRKVRLWIENRMLAVHFKPQRLTSIAKIL